jgi:BirA family transcriptional regulator, biotin operon repressor / biotin---[acetyl-CoA-carboxylase] ligase
MHIINFKTIDSTNSYIKREYKNINHFTWVISDEQTKGKGRLDNTWTGSKDSLMCSILLKEDINLSKINLYPLIAAQSLHKVLSTYHKDIKIKWPNDLYIHDKKIAGILCESIIESNKVLAVIIGFGINLNHMSFSGELKDIASSLYLNTNQSYDKAMILNQLSNQLNIDLKNYHHYPLEVINYCNTYNYLKDLNITYVDNNQIIDAKAININNQGQLIVKTHNQLIALNSGEVSLKRNKLKH